MVHSLYTAFVFVFALALISNAQQGPPNNIAQLPIPPIQAQAPTQAPAPIDPNNPIPQPLPLPPASRPAGLEAFPNGIPMITLGPITTPSPHQPLSSIDGQTSGLRPIMVSATTNAFMTRPVNSMTNSEVFTEGTTSGAEGAKNFGMLVAVVAVAAIGSLI